MLMSRSQKDRWLASLVLAICISTSLTGCWKKAAQTPNVAMRHDVSPQPPKVGPATITISLADIAGNPIAGARVSLEGNMTHPGMKPVFGEAGEVGAGRYRASLEFTMGGDWIILVRVDLPDGQKLEREFEVKGVQTG
jgi:YtkA-like